MQNFKKKHILIFCLVLFVAFSALFIWSYNTEGIKIGSISNSSKNTLSDKFKYFDGTENKILSLKKNEYLDIDYSLTVNSGSINVVILDESNNIIEQNTNLEGTISYQAKRDQDIKIEVVASKASGKYKVSYDTKNKE